MEKKGKIIMTVTMGIMCFILVMIIFMQFKVVRETEETNIDTMQATELRQQLANWKNKYEETKEKYNETIETLESYKEESSAESKTKKTLDTELQNLEKTLGKTDVEGEGVIITLSEKEQNELAEDEEIVSINAEDLIYIVNYLKDSGAEAISINGERVVNTTDIADVGDTIKINSKHLRTRGYEIKAIGNSSYLESSIFGKGGYSETLNSSGIKAEIQRSNRVQISKYDGDFDVKYMEEAK